MAHILVIDDSEVLLTLASDALKASGHEVATALDLAQLDQALQGNVFEMVLVDVKMPEMFGDDVVEFLRHGRELKSKLVLFSDLPEAELTVRAERSGADGFLLKSGGVIGLVEGVRQLLALGKVELRERGPAPEAAASPEPPAGTKRASPADASVRKPLGRILIVDDSETTALLLENELSEKGFEVFIADTADKATKIILKKKTRPDLVLLDVRMPNVNGEQFCRFIKSNSLFAGIKVVLCSAEEPQELKRICREAGADGYVAKDAILAKLLDGELG